MVRYTAWVEYEINVQKMIKERILKLKFNYIY